MILWNGRCQRCHRTSNVHTMSKFNTALICPDCVAQEQKHPDYDKAVKAENAAVKNGDYNFPGIGWPR